MKTTSTKTGGKVMRGVRGAEWVEFKFTAGSVIVNMTNSLGEALMMSDVDANARIKAAEKYAGFAFTTVR